jgi:hypothetical protein
MTSNNILVTAPYDGGDNFFDEIVFHVYFDIIATGGPPAPPFDVTVVGVQYFDGWEEYKPINNTKYDDWIKVYVDKHIEAIKELCRKSVDGI